MESGSDERLPTLADTVGLMGFGSRDRIIRLAAPGIVLGVLLLVPFLNKAFTIDDPGFLLEARQILKTPLQPWSFPMCWNGDETCLLQAGNLGANVREGLIGYLLVPVVLIGGAEWLAHLIQMVLVCLVVVVMAKLALRLGATQLEAIFAGLMVVVIPPLLSMASTAMPDVLALALALTGIESLLAWKSERRWWQGLVAGLALGLAPYARPHVVLFLPLGGLWLLDSLKARESLCQIRRQAVLWSPILLAAVVLLSVNFLTRQRDSGLERNLEIGLNHTAINLFAYFHYLSFPIPLAATWFAVHWRRARILLIPFGIVMITAYFTEYSAWSLVWQLEVAAVFFGFAFVLDMIHWCLKTKELTDLLLCLWVLLPLPAIIYAHLPIKYLVAVLPAVVLILIRLLRQIPTRCALTTYATIVVACAAYSLLLLKADADFAEYGRRAAAELIAPRVQAGEKVWYGGQWGFYWYAQEAGAVLSKPGEPGPNPGELLAVGLMEGGDITLNRFPHRELVEIRQYDSPHGRTMGYGAGLYSNSLGLLLWRWNPRATNTYELWRIH